MDENRRAKSKHHSIAASHLISCRLVFLLIDDNVYSLDSTHSIANCGESRHLLIALKIDAGLNLFRRYSLVGLLLTSHDTTHLRTPVSVI
jgi:hypothetical protein